MLPKSSFEQIGQLVAAIKDAHSSENIAVNALEKGFPSDCWHFEVRSETTKISGWADDNNALLALKKAYSEFIERKAYAKLRSNSTNGFASAPTFAMASESAASEVVERDAVLVTWLAKRAPVWLIEQDFRVLSPWVQTVHAELLALGVVLNFGVVGVCNGQTVTVAALNGLRARPEPFGFAVGYASSTNLSDAFSRSVREVCRYFAHVVARVSAGVHPSGDNEPLTPRDANTPEKHLQFLLHPHNATETDWYWKSSPNILCLPALTIQNEVVVMKEKMAEERVTVRANSPLAQQPFWGLPMPEKLNLARFEECGLTPIIRTEIHPLA